MGGRERSICQMWRTSCSPSKETCSITDFNIIHDVSNWRWERGRVGVHSALGQIQQGEWIVEVWPRWNKQNYNFKQAFPQSMSKIDRIRRKLEENKRKSIFNEVTINPHLSHPSQHHPQLLVKQPLPTTFSLFPLIVKQPSRNASTNHSERSLTTDSFQPDPLAVGRKTLGHIFVERSRLRSHRQRQGHNVDELAARGLNPSTRINWVYQKESMTAPMKSAGSCVINTQTPSAVIILTEPQTPSGSLGRTLFRRTAPKRPSIMIRQPLTPPQKAQSPARKFSISAWDTYDQQ